MLDKVP